jgi:hypothetical protein
MSPPIHKDWWLAAALTGAALPTALAQPANADRVGVVTSVTQAAPGSPVSSTMYLDAASGQRLITGANQTLHVLFSDQSALTVGPNSEVVIADYRYDPRSKDGNLLVNMTKGLLRVVGGLISKRNESRVRTPTATIGIRGGISLLDANENNTDATFLFGQQMRVTDNNGNETQVNRPGFGVSIGLGGLIGEPFRVPVNTISSTLQRLEQKPPPPPSPTPAPVPAVDTGGKPADRLANDRLKDRNDPTDNIDPAITLKKLLGSTAPAPVS